MKRFKLAIAVTLSLGLGMARVLPVQAAAIAKPTDPAQSHSQLLDNYQFKLDDLALPSATKPQARAAQTALESPNWSAKTIAPKASGAAKEDAAKDQEDASPEGFFALVLFVTIAAIFYNLISRGKSAATVSPPGPKTELSSREATAIAAAENIAPTPLAENIAPTPLAETIAPTPLGETGADEPVAVPTPALLPGLLGLGLKLFRQKKAEPAERCAVTATVA